MEVFEIAKKFVGKNGSDFQRVGVQNISPSWPNGASKSAFPHFHGNHLKFFDSVFATSLSGPHRMSVCNLVEIR